MAHNKLKILIDTDIGDDIDDAFALLLAMELRADILGITTVFENTEERARIAKRLMMLYGNGYENVPVYAGCGTPLCSKERNYSRLWQYTPDIESDAYAPNSKNSDDAIDFIINSCKKYKDELIIIAIGPFTNLAKAIKKAPKVLDLAKEVIIMGGAYFKQYADWNVMCDVEAAEILFSKSKNIRCIGADVTHQLQISEEEDKIICAKQNNPAKKYVSELYRLWKNKTGKIGVLHDPLAIFTAFNAEACEYENAPVSIVTSGAARGLTLNVTAYSKAQYNTCEYAGFDFSHTHKLARSVKKELVISEFMKIWKR